MKRFIDLIAFIYGIVTSYCKIFFLFKKKIENTENNCFSKVNEIQLIFISKLIIRFSTCQNDIKTHCFNRFVHCRREKGKIKSKQNKKTIKTTKLCQFIIDIEMNRTKNCREFATVVNATKQTIQKQNRCQRNGIVIALSISHF